MSSDAGTSGYSLLEDFESGIDPFQFDSSNSTVKTHFKGISDEKAFSGKKAFKIDLTFEGGSYYFLKIPLVPQYPAYGRMTFSGRIFVANQSIGKAGLGIGCQILPCLPGGENGSRFSDWYASTDGKWKLVKVDIPARCLEMARTKVHSQLWGIEVEDTAIYMSHIGLYLAPAGKNGDRIVVYLDDLKISGQPSPNGLFAKKISKKWQGAATKAKNRIESWESAIKRIKHGLRSLEAVPSDFEEWKIELFEKIHSIEKQLHQVKKAGFVTMDNFRAIAPFMAISETILANLEKISHSQPDDLALLCYSITPISTYGPLPFDKIIQGEITSQLTLAACPGEYEPISFVVQSRNELSGLELKLSDLRKGKVVIPATALDVKTVKCWYQGGSARIGHWQNRQKRILVPELLLRDNTLVTIDSKNRENHLKLTFPDSIRHITLDSLREASERQVAPSPHQFPIKDSDVTLPIDIPSYSNIQFWITANIPDNSEPGIYYGTLKLNSMGTTMKHLSISLEVLPFKLPSPPFVSSIYYEGVLDPKGIGSVSSILKNCLQMKTEYKNMVAHGVTNPILALPLDSNPSGSSKDKIYTEHLVKKTLELRDNAGVDDEGLYVARFLFRALDLHQPKSVQHFESTNSDLLSLTKEINSFLSIVEPYGLSNVYFFGLDEARGEALSSQLKAWKTIRQAGAKTITTGQVDHIAATQTEHLDILVSPGPPNKAIAAARHEKGGKIWCYANPQGGLEDPEIYRRNYGLVLWKNNYDGAATWIYQSSLGNIWNDFDSANGRDYCFTYPTVDGVIDTIQWEGYREGIDDARYIAMLENAIRLKLQSGSAVEKDTALLAKNYLDELDVYTVDLSYNREQLIGYLKILCDSGCA